MTQPLALLEGESLFPDARPCPFCASSRILVAYHEDSTLDTEGTFRARCYECGAEGPWSRGREMAKRLWQRRKAPVRC